LGLALNAGAYIAEILRAGVEAVPRGQAEAARTLGLSRKTIMRQVVFPQAMRIVAPALASRYIHIMKNSSLAMVVPLAPDLMEMVGQAGRIAGQTFSWVEPLVFAAVGYLAVSLLLSRLLNRWVGRLRT
jgi:ABC-type amino acid transport system permease subunit